MNMAKTLQRPRPNYCTFPIIDLDEGVNRVADLMGAFPIRLVSVDHFFRHSIHSMRRLLIPPEVLKPTRRERRVAGGILDIAVPEVGLQGSRIDAVVGQLEPAGMTQHVRVRLDPQVGGNPGTLDHAVKALS